MSQETPSKPTDLSDKDSGRIDFAAKTAEVFAKTRAEGADIEARVDAVDSFLNSIEEAANQSAIKTSGGEVLSWEDVKSRLDLLAAFYNGDRQVKDAIEDPLLLIPSAGELRKSVNALLMDETTASVLLHELTELLRKPKSAEIESKPKTPQQELGHEAVTVSGVMSPELSFEADSELRRIESAIDEIMAGVPEADRTAVWQYGTALHGHEMSSAMRKMSEETRKSGAPGRYAELYARYREINRK